MMDDPLTIGFSHTGRATSVSGVKIWGHRQHGRKRAEKILKYYTLNEKRAEELRGDRSEDQLDIVTTLGGLKLG